MHGYCQADLRTSSMLDNSACRLPGIGRPFNSHQPHLWFMLVQARKHPLAPAPPESYASSVLCLPHCNYRKRQNLLCRTAFFVSSVLGFMITDRWCYCLLPWLSVTKGVHKKLAEPLSRRVANASLRGWRPVIIDHLYCIVENSMGAYRIEWWKSVINHCWNIHEHDSELFLQCRHGKLDEWRRNPDGSVSQRVCLNTCTRSSYEIQILRCPSFCYRQMHIIFSDYPMWASMRDVLFNGRLLDDSSITGVHSPQH